MNSYWWDKLIEFFAIIGFGVCLSFIMLVLTGLAVLGIQFIKGQI